MESTTTTPSTARIALKYGAITGLIAAIYWVILTMAGLPLDHFAHYVSYLFIIGGLVYAMKEFRSLNNGFMRYGQGLGLGTLTSAVIGLITGLFSTFYLNVIDDSPTKRLWEAQQIKLEEQGMSDAQIEQAIAIGEKVTSFGFLFSVIGMAFTGFILSLIIAAILKRDQDVLDV